MHGAQERSGPLTLAAGSLVGSIAVSRDGTRIVTGYADGVVVWDARTGRKRFVLAGRNNPIGSIALSLDGRHVATCAHDSTAVIWETTTGRKIRAVAGHRGPVRSVAFSPDGDHLITGSEDGTVWVWVVTTGRQILTLKAAGQVASVAGG
jgi:WD40 repeat protein